MTFWQRYVSQIHIKGDFLRCYALFVCLKISKTDLACLLPKALIMNFEDKFSVSRRKEKIYI